MNAYERLFCAICKGYVVHYLMGESYFCIRHERKAWEFKKEEEIRLGVACQMM